MTTYAIGDVHGCLKELKQLLAVIDFNPGCDELWLTGDLVNRGPDSLGVLRYLMSLGDTATCILGNHDLHLIAIASENIKSKMDDSIRLIFEAKDSHKIIDWLRHRPVLHHDAERALSMVHAGIPPQWTLDDAISLAHELEKTLQGHSWRRLMPTLYGNKPIIWDSRLRGDTRLRFISNALTRLRYCTPTGALSLKEKGDPQNNAEMIPWFEHPNRQTKQDRIIFGHWSTLGFYHQHNVCCLDTGCVWGGELTAIDIDKLPNPEPIQIKCAGYQIPG